MRTLTLNIKDIELLRRIEFLPDTDLEKVLLKALMEYTHKQINWEMEDKKEVSYNLSEIMQVLQQMQPIQAAISHSVEEEIEVKAVKETVKESPTVTIVPYVSVDDDFDDDDMDLMK